MSPGRALPLALLAACALACGCAGPLPPRTASFAAASAPALTGVQASYALVQTVHASAVTAQHVADYDTTSIEAMRAPIAFGTPQDLQVRAQMLTLLTGYVAQLAELSGRPKPDTTARKDAGAAAGKAAEQTLSTPADLKLPTLTSPLLAPDATAVQALERLLLARARRRSLPRILAQADAPIARICAALARDFGQADTPGLRNQVHLDYEQRITLADAAIRHPGGSLSAPERRHAIEAELALVQAEQQADSALAQAQEALAGFAAAHHALLESAGRRRDPGFDTQLGRLALAAQKLAALEQQLGPAHSEETP